MKEYKAFQLLQQHYLDTHKTTLVELFHQNPERGTQFSLQHKELFFDFSKNKITDKTLELLIDLASQSNLLDNIEAMFSGQKINNTESKAVLHTALRSYEQKIMLDGHNVCDDIQYVLNKMKAFSELLHNGEHKGYSGKHIADIVNIGIGGSDLGPVLACTALKPYCNSGLKVHFISSVDGYQIKDTLSGLNPETTLFIIASKTFTTQETITNANTARKWFLDYAKDTRYIKHHFVAVSTNADAVAAFGIDPNNMFEFWDFVGGRYSMFSAIGLSIILYIGFDNFKQMLDGANEMDKHYRDTTNLRQNIPVVLALIGIWYNNFYGYTTNIISPYNTRLTKFPSYVQQLEMESNGKSVDKDGKSLEYKTCPVIWGDSAINGQHAYYQLLHQGTSINPMDIIVSLSDKFSNKEHNDILIANAIAQAEAFMCGRSVTAAKKELLNLGCNEANSGFLSKHKSFTGNRPSNMLMLPEISPYYLGMLIALYEHKTFTQGVIWGVNSFDQMGVELGKQLAKNIYNDITSNDINNDDITGDELLKHDSSTNNLIKRYLKRNT